jgi:hypothetical protein
MQIETVYLMTENGRFVCSNPYGDLTIKKDRADESCKQRAAWGDGGSSVVLYNPASERWWAVAPDPATPHVDGIVTSREREWTTFDYAFVDGDQTLMTLRGEDGQYVSRVDIGRPHEHLAANAASADEASRLRVIRFAE